MKIEIHINDRLVRFVRRLFDRRSLAVLAAFTIVTGASVAVAITQAPPNSFSAGATISSSQMNQHFQELYQAVWALEQNQGLAGGSVQTTHIANSAVTEAKLGVDAVTEGKIKNLQVTEQKLGSQAVANAKIKNDAVSRAKIADGAVDASKLSSSAVTTVKLADDAVTRAKIDGTEVAVWRRPTGCRSLEYLLVSGGAPPACGTDACGGGLWYSCTSTSTGNCTQNRPSCSWTRVGYLLAP